MGLGDLIDVNLHVNKPEPEKLRLSDRLRKWTLGQDKRLFTISFRVSRMKNISKLQLRNPGKRKSNSKENSTKYLKCKICIRLYIGDQLLCMSAIEKRLNVIV